MNMRIQKAGIGLGIAGLIGITSASAMDPAVLARIPGGQPAAPSVRVGADVASAYVFRGVTLNDGFVVQPSLEVERGGLTLGAWGNFDIGDYDGAVEKNQFSEIDLYGSFALPFEAMDIALGYCEYAYPGAAGKADREASITFGADLPLSPELLVAYGLDGGIKKDLYVELGLGHEMAVSQDVSATLGATLGYLSPDEGESGLSHFTATAGLSRGIFSAGITYVGQIDDEVLPDGPGAYDVDLYGTIGVSYSF
jgi:uncharacterized protein (TIGR02001 family)